MMPLTEYCALLAWHDWAWESSDNEHVRKQGKAARAELEELAKQSLEHKLLFEEALKEFS